MPRKLSPVCPDCKLPLNGKETIKICKRENLLIKYCEDCGLVRLEILEEIRINAFEDPETYELN